MDSLPKSRHFFCFQLVLIVCTATTHKTSLKITDSYTYMHINIIYIYIYTCRDNISKCSEVDLRGGYHIYIYTSVYICDYNGWGM